MSELPIPLTGFYIAGGTITPSSESYIVREADEALYRVILGGEFCYVLSPRQMGKSSLMARTAARLSDEGVRSAQVDLSLLGSEKGSVTADEWYYGVAYRILRELKVEARLDSEWRKRKLLPALLRFTEFLFDLLNHCPEKIVIFVDEIDSTIDLRFSDDFFAAIRACYNLRATKPESQRLTFVLLGVATPPQLISDPSRTPFNVGRAIDLKDFSAKEAEALAPKLDVNGATCSQLLDRILYWTGGHPYLTQALCRAVADAFDGKAEAAANPATERIDRLVAQIFLSATGARTENNLKFVRDRLRQGRVSVRKVLNLYARVLTGKDVEDKPASSLHTALRLSGVVKADERGFLRVRNHIYEKVFDQEWVRREMPSNALPLMASLAGLVVFGFIGLVFLKLLPAPYIQTLRTSSAAEDAYRAYNGLRRNPIYDSVRRGEADHLLATFWEGTGNRDSALVTLLRELAEQDSDSTRCSVADLIGQDYAGLVATYRHGASVRAAVFSPDGGTVLTGSSDYTGQLWRVDTGAPLTPPLRHRGAVNAVAFSPDGQTVLTGSSDNTAQLWRVDTGAPLTPPLRHRGAVNAVAFSPDGKTVLTGSSDNTAQLWRVDTGAPLTPPLRHRGAVNAVIFSPDGKTVLTGSSDDTAQLWRVDTGAPLTPPLRHRGAVNAVIFSPDGKTVLTGSSDNTAQLWRVDTGAPLTPPLRHRGAVNAVIFSPDGKMLLTGSADDAARLWRADTGAPLTPPLQHLGPVNVVAFSPDGKRVLTGSGDGTARLWDADTGAHPTPCLQHLGPVNVVAFSPDGKRVLTGSGDATARLWEANADAHSTPCLQHQNSLHAVALSPDGSRVLTGGADGTAQMWKGDTCQPLTPLLLHSSFVEAVAFSPDGKTAATGGDDGVVRLWSSDTGAPLALQIRQPSAVTAVAYSPDGRTLLTGGDDNSLRLWAVASGALLIPPKMVQAPGFQVRPNPQVERQVGIVAIAFSRDSKMVLTGSVDGVARLFRVDGGELRTLPLQHQSAVSAAAFSPDGKIALTGSIDRTARLWRVDTGEPLTPPLQLPDPVDALAFSPDGSSFVVGTRRWISLRSWNGHTSELLDAKWLPGSSMGALYFESSDGGKVKLTIRYSADSAFVKLVSFRQPDMPPIKGDSRVLLKDWEDRLALTFDSLGHIAAPYPINSPILPPTNLRAIAY